MSDKTTKQTLSPEDVRQLMHPLRFESGQIEMLIEDTRKRRRKNKQQILGIQALCTHKNVRQIPIQDCANKKETICCDCGARVKIRV